MWNWIHLYTFIFSLFLSLLLTSLARRIALRLGIVDQPAGRKIHLVPKPLLGGIAIYLSFILTILINMAIVHMVIKNPAFTSFLPASIVSNLKGAPVVGTKLWVILAGGTIMILLGLLDDIRNIRFKVKLIVQIASAFLLIGAGIRISIFFPNTFFSSLITLIWVVGITNAFNLLDNMDGLSAGVAIIATILFAITALQQGQLFVCTILIAFAGSLAGFLRYNFHPAKIFMGDTGSLFIGYTLASLTVLNTFYSEGSPTLFPIIMPVLILGIPIFDTLSVICLRLKHGESIFKADNRHFSHRLVSLGLTQRQAVLLVYLVTFCVGINATLLRNVQVWGALIILLQAIGIFGIIIALELAARKKQSNG